MLEMFVFLISNLSYKSHMLIVYYLDINNFVVWLMCMQFFLSRRRCKKEFLLAQITQLLWAITSVWKQYTVTDFRTATSSKIRSQSRIVCNFRIRRHSLQKRQIFTHREKIRDSVKNFFVCIIHKIRVSSKNRHLRNYTKHFTRQREGTTETKDFRWISFNVNFLPSPAFLDSLIS